MTIFFQDTNKISLQLSDYVTRICIRDDKINFKGVNIIFLLLFTFS